MQIVLDSHDDSEEDCKRDSYFTEVNGKRHYLASCSLGSRWTVQEIILEARKLFGQDVEIDWNGTIGRDTIEEGTKLAQGQTS